MHSVALQIAPPFNAPFHWICVAPITTGLHRSFLFVQTAIGRHKSNPMRHPSERESNSNTITRSVWALIRQEPSFRLCHDFEGFILKSGQSGGCHTSGGPKQDGDILWCRGSNGGQKLRGDAHHRPHNLGMRASFIRSSMRSDETYAPTVRELFFCSGLSLRNCAIAHPRDRRIAFYLKPNMDSGVDITNFQFPYKVLHEHSKGTNLQVDLS